MTDLMRIGVGLLFIVGIFMVPVVLGTPIELWYSRTTYQRFEWSGAWFGGLAICLVLSMAWFFGAAFIR